ncbi:MAG: hypothetical protein KDK50_01545 [Chlamydiia bacterium]|nr:hypothetical protein [Chlamydiia bacterium]
MKNNIKTLWTVAGMTCGLLTTALSAGNCGEDPCRPTPPPPVKQCPEEPKCVERPAPPCVKPPEPKCAPRCDTPPAGMIMDDCQNMGCKVITPNAGPRVCMGADVFVTADFILWTYRQEGMEFAMTGSTGTVTSQGRVFEPSFGLEPGFKVGLGLNLGHDGWDVFAEYTWLTTNATRKVRDNNTMTNLWNGGSQAQVLTGSWDSDFNVIDLELGRNFFVSQYLTLRPHYGLKGSWQSQDFKVISDVNNILTGNLLSRRTMKQGFDYWGIGIRTGMDTAWHFTKCWSIYGNFALSALWSGFDIDRKDETFNNTNGVTTQNVNTENDFKTVLPVLEIALGLRWEMWFSNDDYHFGIDAGWEEQVWWGMNRYIVLSQPQRDNGDLTFQGLTLKFRFDF